MIKNTPVLFLLLMLLSLSCATSNSTGNSAYRPVLGTNNAFIVTQTAEEASYGYTQKNPIKVGGVKDQEGPLNQRRFLNALAGPNGEPISYQRLGSCCAFKTKNGLMGEGMLDRYELVWEGLEKPLILYINMYDHDELKIPAGLTARK